jgi:para-aminobenzoate synthetase component I
MRLNEFTETLNDWGKQKVPFLFLIDFEMENPLAFRLNEVPSEKIWFKCGNLTNCFEQGAAEPQTLNKTPIPFDSYQSKFDLVRKALENGDSYLTNLTIKTKLQDKVDLRLLFIASKASYKLMMKDTFLVFSPETFIRINDGRIYTYPMKGTIDAAVPDAKDKILSDVKELAEHVTIVDLLRNDLSIVADNVTVTRFRYLQEIKTNEKSLLQVSSEITGTINSKFEHKLGSLLVSLLPAGSVSGAPKNKTVQIIRRAEREKRGYYTGVFGIYDGQKMDSAVMIRFIEQQNGEFFYRSGGGITTQSEPVSEFQEAIDKVYVPVD